MEAGRQETSELSMFKAILADDKELVKELIVGGIDKHTVIRNPYKWRGVTFLGLACYENNLAIVKFLVDAGTSVNFSDSYLQRTALHWACLGSQLEIGRYLIENGADVNHADKDNCTPLHQAALSKDLDMIKMLINNGANILKIDHYRASILHYGILTWDKNMVETAIRAGCILNNYTTIGERTPLENLVHQKDQDNIRLLLEAGYSLENEFWIKSLFRSDSMSKFIQEIHEYCRNPRSLKSWCRYTIRKQMKGVLLEKKISSLCCPTLMKKYLLLDFV